MNYRNIYSQLSKYISLVFIFYFISCAPSKETRYETKPKDEKSKFETLKVVKTMEVRERELIKKLNIAAVDRIYFEYNYSGQLANKGKISTVEYNQEGLLTRTVIFDEKGKVQNRFDYKYDSKGFRIESLRYDAQNNFDKKYTYVYDAAGNKIKSTRFNSKGKAEKYYLYDYDSNLNLISDEWYDINGDLEYKIENEYDDAGNKRVSYSYGEDGKLNYKYVFKYDDKMNVIEEQKFDDQEKLVGIIQYLYKYDQ